MVDLFSSRSTGLPLFDQSPTGNEGNTNDFLETIDFGTVFGQSVHAYDDIKVFDFDGYEIYGEMFA